MHEPEKKIDDSDLRSADDAELLALFVTMNDRACMAELIRRYYRFVLSIVGRKVSNEHDLQDAVQSTFLVLMKTAKSIRNRNSLAAWLHGVAHRTSLRVRNRASRFRNEDEVDRVEELPDDRESPFSLFARKMELEVLDQELQLVKETYREVLVEHYLLGRSAAEISERFEMSQSTIEGRLRRGRRELRLRMLRRGYRFSSAIAAVALNQSLGIPSARITEEISKVMDWSQNSLSGTDSTVASLVSEELSMASFITSKAVLGTAVAAVTLSAIGMTALLGQVNRVGEGRPPSVTLRGEPLPSSESLVQTQAPGNRQAAQNAPTADPFAQPGGKQSKLEIPAWATRASGTTRAALNALIEPNFNAQPLQTVMDGLADELILPCWIDVSNLDLIGVDPDLPITLNLPPLPLKQALKYILDPHELGYRIDGDVLVVSSKEVVNAVPTFRAYDLSFVSSIASEREDVIQLAEKCIRTIEPGEWLEGAWTTGRVGDSLVVAASEMAHGDIELLLSNLVRELGSVPESALSQASKSRRTIGPPSAPTENPFGGPEAAAGPDPFGNADPFGENSAGHDPFGGSAPGADDPFGSGSEDADPFGA